MDVVGQRAEKQHSHGGHDHVDGAEQPADAAEQLAGNQALDKHTGWNIDKRTGQSDGGTAGKEQH